MTNNYDTLIQPPFDGQFFKPDDDHNFVGENYWHGTAGENLTIMNLVGGQSDGAWDKTDADVESKTDTLIGFACATVNAADTLNIILAPAVVRDDSWTWATVFAPVYISAVAGAITDEAPSTIGQFSRKIGYVIDSHTIFFDGLGTVIRVK